jgi:Ice-binding-like
MNDLKKYLSKSLLATAALLMGASPAWADGSRDASSGSSASAISLGTASAFSVLGSPVTTVDSTITGDVGSAGAVTLTNSTINGNLVYSGALTNTGSTISGTSTTPLPNQVVTDFNSAYAAALAARCTATLGATITGPVTLLPGVYCTAGALTGAGVLTLDARGNANAVWIFKIGAALTGTGFSVVMANGGQPCNVFWAPGAGVTMTTSAFSGNILAGGATGAITFTGVTLAGRALTSGAVKMTGANVIGCAALPGPSMACKDKDHDDEDKDKAKDKDRDHSSDARYPFGSNEKGDGKSGKSGKW